MIRRALWLLFFLLCAVTRAEAAIVFFAGAETGDTLEWASNVNVTADTGSAHTGQYGYKSPNNSVLVGPTGLNAATVYERFWYKPVQQQNVVQYVAIAAPGSGSNTFILGATGGNNGTLFFCFSAVVQGCTHLATGATNALDRVAHPWYLIEIKMVVSATVGGMEVKLNGSVDFSSFVNNTGTSNIDHLLIGAADNPPTNVDDTRYDDFIASTSGYIGSGGSIARQGVAGTPTYDAWTKNSCAGGTIDGCWSDTPFNTTSNATSSTASAAQTMDVHSFATTQAGHGTETIGTHDTINACKTAFVAKTGSANTAKIRRRIGGSDTDTSVSLTTSDKYFDDGIWTASVANLNAAEIGVVHSTTTDAEQVEDMWLMCDYLGVTVPIRHRAVGY